MAWIWPWSSWRRAQEAQARTIAALTRRLEQQQTTVTTLLTRLEQSNEAYQALTARFAQTWTPESLAQLFEEREGVRDAEREVYTPDLEHGVYGREVPADG